MDTIVRPVDLSDLGKLILIDHSFHTDYVWQMELSAEDNRIETVFHEIKLPRSMLVEYPRHEEQLVEEWKNRSVVLVADFEEEPIGYCALLMGLSPGLIMITDLVVTRRFRRHGVGSSLLSAAQNWSVQQYGDRLQMEMQSKNHPAIQLAFKNGFEFCGYCDRYYANQDIALFFTKRILT
jgi:ribosomal protein S18 acetylase RimI-like enzyme